MAEAQTDADKTHEPTQRRLDELRRDGDIASSVELTAAAGLLGYALAMAAMGALLVERMGSLGLAWLGQADRLAPRLLSGQGALLGQALVGLALPLAAVFGLPLALALGVAFVQRGLVFSPARLAPRLARLSPLAGARNRFGREGLVSFARSLLKAGLILLALGLVLRSSWPDLATRFDLTGGQAGLWLVRLCGQLLAVAAALGFAFGALDYFWQWWLHRQRARMTREELKSEMKDSEGDPHLKMHRRQRAQEIALNKMLAAVPQADVVVVNPTHYAVALKWKRGDKHPPQLLAKGVDEVAARIRARAGEAGVPIFSDPPTARAIHASVEVGRTIAPEHYRAVAAAIRFAERLRRKARGGWHVR